MTGSAFMDPEDIFREHPDLLDLAKEVAAKRADQYGDLDRRPSRAIDWELLLELHADCGDVVTFVERDGQTRVVYLDRITEEIAVYDEDDTR